jgi:hypothetical protein
MALANPDYLIPWWWLFFVTQRTQSTWEGKMNCTRLLHNFCYMCCFSRKYRHTCAVVHANIHTRTRTRTHCHKHTHTRTHTQTHTHKHTYIHTHTHTYNCHTHITGVALAAAHKEAQRRASVRHRLAFIYNIIHIIYIYLLALWSTLVVTSAIPFWHSGQPW